MRKMFIASALLIALLIVFTGCAGGSPDASPSPSEDATPSPEATEDTRIKVKAEGSDFVAKLVDELAQTYMEANQDIAIELTDTNSNLGIAALAKGDMGFAVSSRALKDSEKAVFPGMKETMLCMDGIAVIVNADSPVSSLTAQQIKDVFTGKITDWSEVGGTAGKISVYTMESSAEIRKLFNSFFLGTDEDGNQVDTDDYSSLVVETGEEIIAEVLEDKTAIGYVPLSEVVGGTVKTLAVDGAVASAESVKNGSYPYALSYYILTLDPSAEALAFVEYCTGADAKAYMITNRLIVQ